MLTASCATFGKSGYEIFPEPVLDASCIKMESCEVDLDHDGFADLASSRIFIREKTAVVVTCQTSNALGAQKHSGIWVQPDLAAHVFVGLPDEGNDERAVIVADEHSYFVCGYTVRNGILVKADSSIGLKWGLFQTPKQGKTDKRAGSETGSVGDGVIH